MGRDAVGSLGTLVGAAVVLAGFAVALPGAVLAPAWGIAPFLGLFWPPIGLAIGAMARRTGGDRARGDALVVRGGMHCHLFALVVAVLLAGGWLAVGVPGSPLAVLAWMIAAVGYAGVAYAWDRATPTNVDAVGEIWRS